MNRPLLYLASLAIITVLALMHFSLAGAQTPVPTPTPTPTPTPPPASASMVPSSGGVDRSVRVNGQNFNVGQSISITFGGQPVRTTAADGSGSFSDSFNVPALQAGQYPVRAGSVFVGNFTINSSFQVSPSSGPSGPPETAMVLGPPDTCGI